MKATIVINRNILGANKKATEKLGRLIDTPAISIRTHLGIIYCKEIEFLGISKLIQNAASARCSGATIWIEAEFEDLVIDGKRACRSMLKKESKKTREGTAKVKTVK